MAVPLLPGTPLQVLAKHHPGPVLSGNSDNALLLGHQLMIREESSNDSTHTWLPRNYLPAEWVASAMIVGISVTAVQPAIRKKRESVLRQERLIRTHHRYATSASSSSSSSASSVSVAGVVVTTMPPSFHFVFRVDFIVVGPCCLGFVKYIMMEQMKMPSIYYTMKYSVLLGLLVPLIMYLALF